MRIGLVSSEKSLIDISGAVASALRSQIHGVQVSVKIAPTNLDVVSDVVSMKGFDLVVVLLYYEGSNASPDVSVLMGKLVDLDSGGFKILKFVEQGDDFDADVESSRVVGAVLLKLFGSRKKAERHKGSYSNL